MAGNKIGLVNQVTGVNFVFAKSQMGNSCSAGFFGVIYKVSLGVKIVPSPIILIEFLLALTVPSDPRP